jgi:Spy/CpxP family protein refolding chaperone
MPAGLTPVSANTDAPEVDMLIHHRTWVAGLAVAFGLACAAQGYGQTTAAAPAGTAPARAATAQAAKQAGTGTKARLNLTDAQREQIRAQRDAQRNDERALAEKMRAAREQLRQAMRADVPDEAAVRAAAGAVAALQADRVALRARSRAQFMNVLTPDQQARMKQARARLEQRMQRAVRAGRAERQMQMRRNQLMPRNQLLRQWRWWI